VGEAWQLGTPQSSWGIQQQLLSILCPCQDCQQWLCALLLCVGVDPITPRRAQMVAALSELGVAHGLGERGLNEVCRRETWCDIV
jgi:hypothetical protein